jgi:hypothetical protein
MLADTILLKIHWNFQLSKFNKSNIFTVSEFASNLRQNNFKPRIYAKKSKSSNLRQKRLIYTKPVFTKH